MSYYILQDEEAVEVDYGSFIAWLKNHDTRVDRTYFKDEDILVSTVFLGIDHGWDDETPPHIFETMIFGGEHDEYQARYSTLAEARAGHLQACRMVKPCD